jgi:hypothetical protein
MRDAGHRRMTPQSETMLAAWLGKVPYVPGASLSRTFHLPLVVRQECYRQFLERVFNGLRGGEAGRETRDAKSEKQPQVLRLRPLKRASLRMTVFGGTLRKTSAAEGRGHSFLRLGESLFGAGLVCAIPPIARKKRWMGHRQLGRLKTHNLLILQ